FTAPDSSQLVALESRQRVFPAGLAEFLRARDQRCATPFCDAPIRHLDHVRPHARGGLTTAANGQGLCEACNHTKELPGFRSTRDPETGTTTLTTPTGHRYGSSPPPVLGHPVLPAEPYASGIEADLRRRLDLAA
ncbi:HNH endonuclease, partial [Kineococcus rubinsiae]|uniref:HNH endonuclease n=1 Tax=Kineococcus rubinsiae TaxID=2609562 RepID=UPI00142FBACB